MGAIDTREAIIRLYEDYTLTDGLDDEQAQIVHNWGEAQIQIKAGQVEDSAAFEQAFGAMRRVLKMLNRFMNRRADLDDEQQRTYIRRLIENAQNAGYPPEFIAVAPVTEAVAVLDDTAALRALLALVETGASHAPGLPGAPPNMPVRSPDDADDSPDDADSPDADDSPDDADSPDADDSPDNDADDSPRKFWRPPGLDDIPGADRK